MTTLENAKWRQVWVAVADAPAMLAEITPLTAYVADHETGKSGAANCIEELKSLLEFFAVGENVAASMQRGTRNRL